MSNVITFGSTVLEGTGKRGILKPMDPGGLYYLVNAGGFNLENRSGIKYRFNDYLRECMRPESDLNRRISEGQLQCELGHPPQYYWERVDGRIVQTAITDVFQWIHRLRTIIEANVCGSIRKIHWVMNHGETGPVYNMIEVRPFGVHGHVLEASLQDPDINTAFSIRTVTKPQKMGDRVREVDYFTGYDLVIEQGMLNACKFRTAGLEDFMNHQMTAQLGEMTTSFDEVVFVVERELAKESFMARFEGTESHKQIVGMMDHLKKRYHHNAPVRLKTTSSLSVF